MRAFLLNLLKILIRFLQKRYDQAMNNGVAQVQPYHSLSPIDNIEEKQYTDALFWALEHRKAQDIKNIALTGPYGSGKSSILKTFQSKYKSQFQFLNLSLATFKEELKQIAKGKQKKEIRDESRDLLRLIELSILQQIFYHEKDSKIPDSRFKKIRSFKKLHLLLIAACIVLLLLCGFNLFWNSRFYTFFGLEVLPQIATSVRYSSLIIFIAGLFFIIYRSIRLLNSIKLSKFKFHDAEIEIDEGISKSILNNHLDEILYFFEVTDYDVVLIEDLDRFEQTEIFTKLRELNLLINNSKKIKKEVAFIYAVRDDMFQDKDRTKFFDFIIPVIPVINSSNSNNKLLKIIRDNAYDISDDLIDDIGLFVDDMRLLYNITNEYHLYRGLLDARLIQNKLLSIIVYKNIFPNDFVKLSTRDGDLYRIFANKQTYVARLQKQLEAEIEEMKVEIKRLRAIRLTDVLELRRLYLLHYPVYLPHFNGFYNSDKDYTLAESAQDKPFQLIVDKKMRYKNFVVQYGNTFAPSSAVVEVDFATVEASVDPQRTYADRLADLDLVNNNQIGALQRQIEEKERKKTGARHLKIKDLISSGAVKIEIDDKKKFQLVNVLMRAGHIDEEYLDYISIFYEGSITKDDRDFLLNVKSQIASEFNFGLQHLDKLVPKIGHTDFEQAYCLNYSLLDFLLTDSKYETQLNATLKLLKQADNVSIAFIDGFIGVAENLDQFINKLAAIWPQFWHVISSQAAYANDHKFKYLDLIIGFAELPDIEKLAHNSDLQKTMLSRRSLLSDISYPEKFQKVVTSLKLCFSDIDLENAPEKLVDFIYQNNHYLINPAMLRRVLKTKGTYEEESFNHANFDAIQSSGATALIGYIEENLPEYISLVYLDLEDNTTEPEESLLELLNNDTLAEEDRQAIVEKTTATITYLSNSSFPQVDGLFLSALRVAPLWENVFNNFEHNENTLTAPLITFLNHLPNAQALSEASLTTEDSTSESYAALIDALVKDSHIGIEAFRLLVLTIPEIAETPEFAEIDEDHAEILIENNLIKLSPENFATMKEQYELQHISLAEKQAANFVADIANYTLDSTDLTHLLSSKEFDMAQKQLVLDFAEEDLIIGDTKLLAVTGRLALQQPHIKLSKKILLAILMQTLSTAERIKLFNMNFNRLQAAEVTAFLLHLPQPYSDIANKGRRPLLDFGQENHCLVNNLKTIGYISKRDDEKKGIRISTFKK